MAPPPPSPPAEFSVDVLSTLDLDFLNFAGITALAFTIVYIIFTCYERKYLNQNGDIEGGRPPLATVAESRDSETEVSPSRSRAAVISTKLFQYGTERGLIGKNSDCSICLDEFTEGEICRMLPNCRHIFHRFCIDQWLPNERHCPLCRCPVYVRIVYSNPS